MNQLPGKSYFQQRQRNRLYELVLRVVEDAGRLDGVRRRDIAEKIGSNPSQVTRWLSGPSNWTIDSVSDVLWAIGGEMEFNFVRFEDMPRKNRTHPLNDLNIAIGSSLSTAVPSNSNVMIQTPISNNPSTNSFSINVAR